VNVATLLLATLTARTARQRWTSEKTAVATSRDAGPPTFRLAAA
jgi:hypothetical protein